MHTTPAAETTATRRHRPGSIVRPGDTIERSPNAPYGAATGDRED